MKAEDFFKVLASHQEDFEKHGFKKKSRGIFISDTNIKMRVFLDKWGWDPETGWGFNVRLEDLSKAVDNLENVHPKDSLDLKPHYLVENQLLTPVLLDKIYSENNPQLKKVPWTSYGTSSPTNKVSIRFLT